jgi:predicted XRE-type DNA-binding protein
LCVAVLASKSKVLRNFGEGCCYINLQKSASHKLKERVKLVFQLTQHVRDLALMQSLVSTLDCGNIYVDNEVINFKITQFKDLTEKVLPFSKNTLSWE